MSSRFLNAFLFPTIRGVQKPAHRVRNQNRVHCAITKMFFHRGNMKFRCKLRYSVQRNTSSTHRQSELTGTQPDIVRPYVGILAQNLEMFSIHDCFGPNPHYITPKNIIVLRIAAWDQKRYPDTISKFSACKTIRQQDNHLPQQPSRAPPQSLPTPSLQANI